jgi:hypothetical protein
MSRVKCSGRVILARKQSLESWAESRLFHMKHDFDSGLFLFPDTEVAENHIQNIVHIDASGDPSQGTGGQA